MIGRLLICRVNGELYMVRKAKRSPLKMYTYRTVVLLNQSIHFQQQM